MKELINEKVVVLIPCFNESMTITKVITDFRNVLPNAKIIVFDNNSTDDTYSKAIEAGAIVIKEKRQGKGFVISAMLRKVSADIYVMVDGDDTYPVDNVIDLIQPILKDEADMVVGQRLSEHSDNAFRSFHIVGNKLVSKLINLIFSSDLKDPMSGYRVFTREVALELPVVAFGFDVETEMTIQLLYRKFIIKEIPISYRNRPLGSVSKLNTFKDGFLVLRKILSISRAYKPLTFFGGSGIFLVLLSLLTGGILFIQINSIQSNLLIILLFFTAICFMSGVVLGAVGIILHTLNFRLLEVSNIIIKSGPNHPSKFE